MPFSSQVHFRFLSPRPNFELPKSPASSSPNSKERDVLLYRGFLGVSKMVKDDILKVTETWLQPLRIIPKYYSVYL